MKCIVITSRDHCTTFIAVKDRVDLSGISNILPVIDLTKIQLSSILPSANEYQELCKNFEVLIARIIVNHSFLNMEKACKGVSNTHSLL